MVCSKCKFLIFFSLLTQLGEKKLDKVITPDVWKDGARNTTGGKDGGRKLATNKLLEKKKYRYIDPIRISCNNLIALIRSDPSARLANAMYRISISTAINAHIQKVEIRFLVIAQI